MPTEDIDKGKKAFVYIERRAPLVVGGFMPELPEVECLTNSLSEILAGKKIVGFWFGRKDLRWPIPIRDLKLKFANQEIISVTRRSKYILISTEPGIMAIHLGMSGNILFLPKNLSTRPHTHGIFTVSNGNNPLGYLHFVDPRRFGSIHFVPKNQLEQHFLFKNLGPEPLSTPYLAEHLFEQSRGKAVAVKTFIMNAHYLVGVGNIYANESLFLSGIHPLRQTKSVSLIEWERLVNDIKNVLKKAIAAGGTSFKDYKNIDGESGYFKVALNIYGKEAAPCVQCGSLIAMIRLSGRATYFCPRCQNFAPRKAATLLRSNSC